MFYLQYQLPKILYLIFLCLVFFRSAHALPCEDTISVDADKKEIIDGIVHYQGDVQIKSGSLIIKSNELSIKEELIGSIVIEIKNAAFSFKKDNKTISGYSENIIFHAEECVLDLIGHSRIITNKNKVHEYNTVRYFLNEGVIKPLWLYMDQGINVAP